MFPCLGMTWLGMCSYDPGRAVSYFSLGDAVAAIAVTLALQNFMKPIYRLRLAARYLSLKRLYILIFAGVGMTMVAAIVPNLPFLGDGSLRYPIVWELCATVSFVVAYGAVALTIVRPLKVRLRRVEPFARAVATLLAQASESDHIDVLPDVQASLPVLVKSALFLESRHTEFSAFDEFTYREKIRQSSYAQSILRILSDPFFCQSLIRRAPWNVAKMISVLSNENLHCQAAEQFVQELARQAIVLDDGIMSREVSFKGFATAPELSDAMFSDDFIVRSYDPLNMTFWEGEITAAVIRRFNAAAKRCFLSMIKTDHVEFYRVAYSIKRFYESAKLGRPNAEMSWTPVTPSN
jgi:hypothetical protein